MTKTPDTPRNEKSRGPGVLKVMQSIAAGALGVQSSKRREEDFGSHSPWPYIIGGLLFTALFIGTLVLVVQVALAGQ
ncbi:hypothetical protein LCGC14_1835310 [marine sediment metagenome]|uniref:DUF2970 domain-containing protein n=2 Tax=root TaxID=1 RepID=A0A831VZR2_9GAMM|nr:DUF2970 domain-containing protein [Marinobacter antarcticus]HEA52785.1 DUF2970 domain-containing protein [Marinobacter antarcticus]